MLFTQFGVSSHHLNFDKCLFQCSPLKLNFPSLSILLCLHQNFGLIFRLFDMKLQKTIPWVVNLKDMLIQDQSKT